MNQDHLFPTIWDNVKVVDKTTTGVFVEHPDKNELMWVPFSDIIEEFDGIRTNVADVGDCGTLVCMGWNAESAGWM